jgi:hypothetical protein
MDDDSTDHSERTVNVHHRDLFTDPDQSPGDELVSIVAELKGVAPNELDSLYSWVDSLVEDLYSSPPPTSAQALVEFSYEGYRITLYQDGHAVFMARDS